MRRYFKGFLAVGSALVLLQSTPGEARDLTVDLEDAADHHLSAQGSYKKGLKNSWEWRFGSGRSATNITGINAHGLLAAYRLTGLQAHEQSALKAAGSLVAAFDRGWKHRRPHTQDVEFLVAAGYVFDGAKWFGVITGNYSAPQFARHIVTSRQRAQVGSFAGWDLASAIRAAVAVGEVTFARQLIDAAIRYRSSWDRTDKAQARVLSRASLLWALADFMVRSALTPDQQRFARSLQRSLLASQKPSGAWPTADGKQLSTQVTAYAVLGLSKWPGGQAAADRGRRWLRRMAQVDKQFFAGGSIWPAQYTLTGKPGSDYISQVQSEVLQALATGR